MLNLIRKMIAKLKNIYKQLPVRPFEKTLSRIYLNYKLLFTGKTVIFMTENIKFELNLDETIDNSIYVEGSFEYHTHKIIKRLVKKNDYVLDIGANIGAHTLFIAKYVGNNGKVIAFEPMPFAREKLYKNITLNSFKNIVVENIALSDVNLSQQKVNFQYSWPLNSGSASDQRQDAIIDFMTLDNYINANSIPKVDFIKLDVDGYEAKVIKGAEGILKRFMPDIIMELGTYTLSSVGDDAATLIDFLYGLGYHIYNETTLNKYPDNLALLNDVPIDGTINIIVSKKESLRI